MYIRVPQIHLQIHFALLGARASELFVATHIIHQNVERL